ncbi:MAG: hypothetical protein JWM11_3523 [Planctomycetaceae bacterium]|nr:hypothetical protein [Planctomycetaceae bacterium]
MAHEWRVCDFRRKLAIGVQAPVVVIGGRKRDDITRAEVKCQDSGCDYAAQMRQALPRVNISLESNPSRYRPPDQTKGVRLNDAGASQFSPTSDSASEPPKTGARQSNRSPTSRTKVGGPGARQPAKNVANRKPANAKGKGSSAKLKPARKPPGALELKALGNNRFEFQAPECALDRDLDLQEAQEMRLASEGEIARDELLYLVADCRGFLEAYLQLAELALEEEDIGLAKGHFGFAYETGLEALPPHFRGLLPVKEGYNRHFFAAGRGLARCLVSRKEPDKAREVLEQLLKFDPTESESRSLLEQLNEREQKK